MDREKIVKGIQECDLNGGLIGNCPYKGILTLLKEKEQEAKPVDLYGKDDWYGLVCVCPVCQAEWMSGKEDTHFCPNCGQAVKWDETPGI